jgi:peptidoglycan/LPS O-acetylase OafA/YrhL
MKQNQIASLTGLRFVAALCVVISHAATMMIKFNNPPYAVNILMQLSSDGMTLFFVLSGFVIYYNYSNSISSRAGLTEFLIARFARLYPLYFLCVCFDLLMKFSYNQFPADRLSALPYYATLTHSWVYTTIKDHSLIYQFGLLPQVTWSISTEFFFYLAFPFICIWMSKLKSVRSGLTAAVIVCVAAIATSNVIYANYANINQLGVSLFGPVAAVEQDSLFRWLAYFSPYVRLFEFALGCLCAFIYLKMAQITVSDREQRFGLWLSIVALVCLPIWHSLMFSGPEAPQWRLLFIPFHLNFGAAPLLAILILCCARYQNFFTRAMSGKKIVLCGEASYSIYLLHFLIINAFRYESPTITSWNVGLGVAAQFMVVLAATIGLALVSHTLIEVPSRNGIRRLAAGISQGRSSIRLSEEQALASRASERSSPL